MNSTDSSDRPRVTGIGGIFFKVQDPAAIKAWYARHLGFNTDDYGTTFEWRQAGPGEDAAGYTTWSPFKADTDYFLPSSREFMVNYRVNDLEGLLSALKQEGINPLGPVQEYEYGKFAHILDLEGNKIELWQPFDQQFGQMVEGNTTY